ncbi:MULTISPECIES: TetR/AcrR family transcriptional regulator [Prauserella salsuginis group]|uniref:TetR/AcrR family transcriptional regulator n=1 Tax=Prauserella salsuginis TaxID=387889 RepID=A0ABW6G0P4_9PSEU|nr:MULTISPECIES: TetR/AcrR family transcriptional regulator [Prauserella salsuginis group]MCR3721929.1 transcriptional regulator, TetR family [Prauserella flava]MCR3735935.1 transcriptional regulator, TetR family [Prauserella salsuginis]
MPKIVDHEQRRNEICDAVLTLVAEGGTRSVTKRAAAERAQWSTGAVNHYFQNRDTLMLGAFRRAAHLQGKELTRILHDSGLSPLERLHATIEATLPLDERRVALTRIFLEYYAETHSAEETHDEVVSYLRNWRSFVTRIIDECKDDGSIVSTRDSKSLAIELVALTDGLAMHALLDPDVLSPLVDGKTLTISFIDDTWGPIQLTEF